MFTNRAKALLGIVAGAVVVGGLAYGQARNTQEIVKLENQTPVVVTKTTVVMPTSVPTSTPSATFKPRISTPASATKGVSK